MISSHDVEHHKKFPCVLFGEIDSLICLQLKMVSKRVSSGEESPRRPIDTFSGLADHLPLIASVNPLSHSHLNELGSPQAQHLLGAQ